jgi:hypothetical protein
MRVPGILHFDFMRQIRRNRRIRQAPKKPAVELKNAENPLDNGDNFVNLIAEIVFENLLNKHKK